VYAFALSNPYTLLVTIENLRIN